MSENRAIVPAQSGMTLSETMTLGEALARSGYFSDAKSAAQAVVKVLAGQELGIGPIAAMTGINIIKGQVSVGANLLAATIKRDGRYNYRVIEHSAEVCEIVFFEGKQEIGRSRFTMEDAKAAQLAGDNWRKYPRNMLFARALSNGFRWYCPDAAGGTPVYTPEELGANVDGETGEVITVTAELVTETPKSDNGDGQHWIDSVSERGTPIRTRFWAWTKGDLALTEDQVHEALGVDHIRDYKGTMEKAKAQIEAWIVKQADAEALAEDFEQYAAGEDPARD